MSLEEKTQTEVDSTKNILEFPKADKESQKHFHNFKFEGILRNKDINLENVIGSIRKIYIKDDYGLTTIRYCEKRFNSRIVIDEDYWNRASHLKREIVVFYELGNCVLKRLHHDKLDADGNCISIMHSLRDKCDNYNSSNRKKYFDELFKDFNN